MHIHIYIRIHLLRILACKYLFACFVVVAVCVWARTRFFSSSVAAVTVAVVILLFHCLAPFSTTLHDLDFNQDTKSIDNQQTMKIYLRKIARQSDEPNFRVLFFFTCSFHLSQCLSPYLFPHSNSAFIRKPFLELIFPSFRLCCAQPSASFLLSSLSYTIRERNAGGKMIAIYPN